MFDTAENKTTIEIEGLIYRVDDKTLLNIPELTLGFLGRSTVIMGPNGAGKSLLLRMIHGLVTSQAGSIRVDGKTVSSTASVQQAFVFQSPVLLRRTVAANVAFVLKSKRKQLDSISELLARVGLAGREKTPARKLSGGEQQRLSIAMALAKSPQILLMDEPTASLDPASISAIETIIKELSENGLRVVIVTHDIGQAKRLADEVVLLGRGQVIEHADVDTFFAGPRSKEALAYLEGRMPI